MPRSIEHIHSSACSAAFAGLAVRNSRSPAKFTCNTLFNSSFSRDEAQFLVLAFYFIFFLVHLSSPPHPTCLGLAAGGGLGLVGPWGWAWLAAQRA